MKQIIVIVSMVIAAFVAACSQGKQTTALGTGKGGIKSIGDLEKVSTDSELTKLKAQLEKQNNLDFQVIAAAAKNKFGTSYVKEQPKQNGNKKKFENVEEPEDDSNKIKKAPSGFAGIVLIDSQADAAKIITSEIKDGEIKYICIRTCEMQIVVVKKINNGHTKSIEAYVGVVLGSDKATISKSEKPMTLKTIEANYEVASDTMNLKFEMTRDKKDLVLISENFIYNKGNIADVGFVDSDHEQEGSLKIKNIQGTKTIHMNFDPDKAIIKLNNDLGLFGKSAVTGQARDSKIRNF